MKFLHDIWYMAGWCNQFEDKPMLRKIANEPVVLYRKADGTLVGLADTCPHRFAPLNQGVVVDDAIQCPYHGLRFNEAGTCVFNPHGDGTIPRAARVKSYPIVERDTIAWIWIGDPAKQDPSKIEDFSILNNQDDKYTFTAGGMLRMSTRYDLIIDNLMDLSHASFLHMKNLGSEALARGIISVRTEGTKVYSDRMGPNGLPSPMMVMTGACKAGEYVDFWADMRWSPPANFFLETGVVPAGQPRDQRAKLMPSVQILTPESENSTLYFIKLFWNYSRDVPGMDEQILNAVLAAFKEEDEWMVQLVDERMDGREFWSLKPILLQGDGGAVQTRRMLEKLVQQQQQQAVAA